MKRTLIIDDNGRDLCPLAGLLQEHGYSLVEDVTGRTTERKWTDGALRFTQFAVDRMTVQAFWITSDGQIFYVNDAACRALGYTRSELVGMSVPDIDPDYTPDIFAEAWLRLREHGSETFETLHRAKDGQVYPVEIRSNYVIFDGKEYNCAFAVDISEHKAAEEAVRVSEQNYRDIVEHAPFGIIASTRDGKLLRANPAAARILKYDSPEELLEIVNHSSIQRVLFEESSCREPLVERIFTVNSWCIFENRYRCRDGSVITCEVHSRRLDEREGDGDVFESFLNDITGRRVAEDALRESEEKFRLLAETSPTAIILLQGERVVFANRAAGSLTGYNGEENLDKRFWDYVHEDFQELVRERGLARQRGEAVPNRYEIKIVTKDGEEKWLLVSAAKMEYRGKPTGIVTLLDITETKRAEERISAALAEKEILLREVHHRVKNNLQVISALLDLQSDYIRDEQSLGFFRESRDRIKTMALVHERLYNSHDMSSIDFGEYIRNLVDHLSLSYVDDPDRISVMLDVADLSLGIDEAIPCGLIINELVSNSLKHAFPVGVKGEIRVDCQVGNDGFIALGIRDNGVGLPDGLDFRNTESLGLQIVNLLAKQLRGTIEQRNQNGACYSLRFRGAGPGANGTPGVRNA